MDEKQILSSNRHQINIESLINACSIKLKEDPYHRKALIIRSNSYMKKGQYG